MIYTAVVHSGNDTSNLKIHKYIGATSTTFKNRFSNHIHSFKHKKLRFSTSLSNLVHELNYRIVDTDYSYTFTVCNIIYVKMLLTAATHNP